MSDLSRITCACLAAGLSSRMGTDHKLLKFFNDQPVLLKTLEQLDTIEFAQKILIVGYRADDVCAVAAPTTFTPVLNSAYATGLQSSIRTAVTNVSANCDAILICLADQPFDLIATTEQFLVRVGPVTTHTLARAWNGSTPGHPVLIGRNYFERILRQADGDFGCAYLFKENPFLKIELGEAVAHDLDTPDDFARATIK